MTRVLLVDDHTLFLDGLELLLSRSTGQYSVVGKVHEPLKTLELMEDVMVDLVLIDIEMPGVNGVDLLKRIISRFPSVKVAVITMHDEDQFIQEVMASGGHGFLLKSWDSEDLLQKVNSISKGIRVFPNRRRRRQGGRIPAIDSGGGRELVRQVGSKLRVRHVAGPGRAVGNWRVVDRSRDRPGCGLAPAVPASERGLG